MEVVSNIGSVRTGDVGPFQNVPLTAVVIQTARVVEAKP
jgi:peptidyl-prolyl cis-trans isomerase A (cyclophilin A)